MGRNFEEQKAFRDALFDEHYYTFQGHRIFCHATADGYFNKPWDIPQKVQAHHIEAWSLGRESVNIITKGILVAPYVHDMVHQQTEVHGLEYTPQITRQVISSLFELAYPRFKHLRLPDGSFFVDCWEYLLVSKGLVKNNSSCGNYFYDPSGRFASFPQV